MPTLNGKSLDILEENIKNLRQLFPEVECDGKIDFDMLRQILGEYVDDDKERYNFKWNGKGKALRFSQTPSTGTLRPCKEESKNWDDTQNLYIEGDNLEVLKILQKSYHGKIKMIYIDPPYNTGNDFVYPDNYHDSIENYKTITGQTDEEGRKISTNTEASGRFHTDWLNMMYPRLRLARNLLTEDGAIFISIGQAEQYNLEKLCDEIFGEDNRVGVIYRLMKSGGNKGQYFSPNVEYILVYAKNRTSLGFFREKISEDLIEKSYNNIETYGDKKGEAYAIKGLCQPGLGIRPNQRYWIECPDGSFVIPRGVNFPSKLSDGEKILPTDEDTCWKWTYDRYVEEKAKNNILFKPSNTATALVDENGNTAKWNVFNKIWLSDRLDEGRVPVDIITAWENRVSSQELKTLDIPFDFAKPVDLVKYLIEIIDSTENSFILDFFSGSATTAHAVMQLNAEDDGNRRFICVQLPEPTQEDSEAFKAGYKNICEIGKERIRRAGEKIKEEVENGNAQLKIDEEPKKVPDIGFKVFKLDSSNLKKWNPDFDNIERTLDDMINNYVPDRTEEDVVYEFMLKMGLDLSYPVDVTEIDGKKVYSIGFGALMMCLDDNITVSVAEGMVKLYKEQAPETWKVVFKDNGFVDDCTKTNVKLTLIQAGLEEDAFTTV